MILGVVEISLKFMKTIKINDYLTQFLEINNTIDFKLTSSENKFSEL